MLRRLLTLASALSLLLCTAAIVVWVRSYNTGDLLVRATEQVRGRMFEFRQVSLESSRGGVSIGYGYFGQTPSVRGTIVPQTISLLHLYHPMYPVPVGNRAAILLNRLGFCFGYNGGADPASGSYASSLAVVAPHWFFILILTGPSAVMFWQARRRHRSRHLICATCGYDLRATPDRCPECGTVPEKREVAG